MKPEEMAYCEERGAPPGSSFRAALTGVPARRRTPLLILLALRAELEKALEGAVESPAGRGLLAWWSGELSGREPPRHPVSRAIAAHLSHHANLTELLQAWPGGYLDSLEGTPPPDFRALRHRLHLRSGVLGPMMAEAAGCRLPASSRAAHRIWMGIGLTRVLRDLRPDLDRGRLHLPLDALRAIGIPSPEGVAGAARTGRLQPLLNGLAETAEGWLRSGLEEMPAGEGALLLPVLRLARIHLALLEALREEGFPVYHQRIALTPLRSLWIAWRTRGCRRR